MADDRRSFMQRASDALSAWSSPPGERTAQQLEIPRAVKIVGAVLSMAVLGIAVTILIQSLNDAGVSGLRRAWVELFFVWLLIMAGVFVFEYIWKIGIFLRWFIIIASALVTGCACAMIGVFEYHDHTEKIELEPANFALRLNSCDPSGVEYGVMLGTSFNKITHFPFDLITMNARPLLRLDRRDDGRISISDLTLYDDRHDVIATVNNDVFWTRNDVRTERRTPWALDVYDHNNDLALRLAYLNPKVIAIAGIFRNKSFPMFVDWGPDSAIRTEAHGRNVVISHNCMGDFEFRQTDTRMQFGSIIVENKPDSNKP